MFWRSTPRIVKICLDGAADRLRAEQNGRAWLAWHVEALSRSKKLPELDRLMVCVSGVKKQAPDEMRAIIKTWVAANGGEIRKRSDGR